MNTLPQEEILSLRKRRDQIKQDYGQRNLLFEKYEDIYFMKGVQKPKDKDVDERDWKLTTSSTGRDKVTGLKRILDTSSIQIKVKEGDKDAKNSDKIEKGLKRMLQVSGEYKKARPEKDTNLSAVLYGPVVLTVDCLNDLITAKTKVEDGVGKYIKRQLETIQKRTPFLIDTMNAKESYPEWGEYGMVGHLQEYKMKGSVIKERWGETDVKDEQDYVVQDFFHYDKRLVETNGKTLFAGEWLTYNGKGDIEGVTSIPIFVRYAGGSNMFSKPEEQLQSFLYAYAKGEWWERENLFWTYVFTAIYTQGLPGPVIIQDPDAQNEKITVKYTGGVKVITAKGKLENMQVIDGDVLQLKGLMDKQNSTSTIQDQTIGGQGENATFSGYVMNMNAGKLPAIDAKEAQEQAYKDCFLHILQRIKADGIVNDLISPEDIPDNVDMEVTLEPDLQQDDLRNAQIVTQLKGSDANVSDEWLNTNLLKIADSNAMFKQKAKEDIRKAVFENILKNPQYLEPFIQAMMGMPSTPPTPPASTAPSTDPLSTMPQEQGMMPGAGGEMMPQTDAMIPPSERM
jgi:hypothetical protein